MKGVVHERPRKGKRRFSREERRERAQFSYPRGEGGNLDASSERRDHIHIQTLPPKISSEKRNLGEDERVRIIPGEAGR